MALQSRVFISSAIVAISGLCSFQLAVSGDEMMGTENRSQSLNFKNQPAYQAEKEAAVITIVIQDSAGGVLYRLLQFYFSHWNTSN